MLIAASAQQTIVGFLSSPPGGAGSLFQSTPPPSQPSPITLRSPELPQRKCRQLKRLQKADTKRVRKMAKQNRTKKWQLLSWCKYPWGFWYNVNYFPRPTAFLCSVGKKNLYNSLLSSNRSLTDMLSCENNIVNQSICTASHDDDSLIFRRPNCSCWHWASGVGLSIMEIESLRNIVKVQKNDIKKLTNQNHRL